MSETLSASLIAQDASIVSQVNETYFIGGLSFEERCTSFVLGYHSKIDFNRIIFINNTNYSSLYEANRNILRLAIGEKMHEVDVNSSYTISMVDRIIGVFDELVGDDNGDKKVNIIVDISTFTKEILLIILKLCFLLKDRFSSIKWVYSVAEKMSEEWLSRGVLEVKTVLGYSGRMRPSKKIHLIVMAGFEVERARDIIKVYEPDLISIGCGSLRGSISPDFHKINQNFVCQLLSFYGSDNVRSFDFDLDCPSGTLSQMEEYVGRFPDYNTVLAPLNNKISTLGVGMLAIKNDSIQICYATASEYNVQDYSKSSSCFRFFEGFNFKPVKDIFF